MGKRRENDRVQQKEGRREKGGKQEKPPLSYKFSQSVQGESKTEYGWSTSGGPAFTGAKVLFK